MGGESCTVLRLIIMRKLEMSHIQSSKQKTEEEAKKNPKIFNIFSFLNIYA